MAAFIAFLVGGLLGYTLKQLNYEIGFNHGWHKGIDDFIEVLKEEDIW